MRELKYGTRIEMVGSVLCLKQLARMFYAYPNRYLPVNYQYFIWTYWDDDSLNCVQIDKMLVYEFVLFLFKYKSIAYWCNGLSNLLFVLVFRYLYLLDGEY